jgi:competence protein ComEA
MSSGPLPWRDRIDLLTRSPQITPARLAGGAVLAVALALGAWFLLRTPSTPPPESFLPVAGTSGDHTSATTSTTDAAFVIADAAGAVAHPGVYKLSGAARVTDLIDAAGGPAEDADLDRLNLAAVVSDGERVYVPRRGEVVVADVSSATGDGRSTGPVNLNTATLAQLDALPGIGPSTAQAIIDERTRRGGFRAVDDLLDVRGIGPAKLDAIRDLVTV